MRFSFYTFAHLKRRFNDKKNIQKLDGLTHKELKNNIEKVIKDIPKEKYENIINGTYNRTKKYSKKPSNRRKTLKNYL